MQKNQPDPQGSDFPTRLSQPAQRALANAGYTQLSQLCEISEAEFKKLHGIGPNAVGQLRLAMSEKGLSFAGGTQTTGEKGIAMDVVQDGNDVIIEQRTPQVALSIRATVPIERLGEAVGERIQALSSFLKQSDQQDVQLAGPPFVRYFTFGETETDFELGIPISAPPVIGPVAKEGEIGISELPGGSAVTTWHVGPHVKLGDAYARIAEWMSVHNREPGSDAWEVYYWLDLNEYRATATGRTQLVQPLK